jgi:hypothetical protein
LCRSAIHKKLDAGYETGIIRSKEEYRGGNLARLANSAHRDQGYELVLDLLWDPDKYARINRAGADDVHTNLACFEVEGPCARERTAALLAL